MSFNYVRKLPTSEEVKDLFPLSNQLKEQKALRDKKIRDIIQGKSNLFLMIIGPCSADDEDAVVEYTVRLASMQEKVKDKILLVPRVYTNKPRTTGEGYKGMMHQPNPNEKPNIAKGLQTLRRMHIRVIQESGLTGADEMLYPNNYPYVEDLLSYIAVGARSIENQQHRLTVSGVDMPVGMKNPTSGDPLVMLNSIKAAQLPHSFIYNSYEVDTTGNPLTHAMLRGAVNQHGRNIPNYHYEEMIYVTQMYLEAGLKNPSIIVDTNHANSMKKYEEQPRIALEVLRNMGHSKDIRQIVKGLIIESYLLDGRQDTPGLEYGKSITDACLGWNKTEKLIYDIAEAL